MPFTGDTHSLPVGSGATDGVLSEASQLNIPIEDINDSLTEVAGRITTGLAAKVDDSQISAFGLTLVDDADAAAARTTLGAQASDATLTSLSGLSLAEGDMLYATAADTLALLPKGTALQTLVINAAGTAPEWADQPSYSTGEINLFPGGLAAILSKDIHRYDREFMRTVPSIAVWEPWALAPDLILWETSAGARAQVTEASIRERVRAEKRMGVRAIWLKYVEIFGHWFTKPDFTRWDDRDQVSGALTPAKYWHEFPNSFTEYNADDFDLVGVVIDECARNGMFVIIGLGRVGLFNTLSYYQTGTGGYTGPAALTTSAQMDLAIARTRQLHDDITTRFDAYRDWILALSSGFEPDDMATWKVFSAGVTTGSGAHSTVREKGYQWWCSPGEMDDLPAAGATIAARETFAQDVIDCGADVWIAQDAVGPGFDQVAERYSFVSSVPLAQLDEYYSRWRTSLDDAGKGFGTILEHWRMGSEPTTNLTLSAISGAAITATSAFAFFTGGMVGQYITGSVGGNAVITGVTSSTIATLDTTVAATGAFAAGADFSGTSLPYGTFSLNTGYADPYPAEAARVALQMAVHAKYSDEICMYGTSSFTVDDALTVRLPQSLAGVADYRTRADLLFDDAVSRYRTGLVRQRSLRPRLPRRVIFSGTGSTPTGGSYTLTQDRYQPSEAFSRLFVRLRATLFRGETANVYVNDITLRLQINGADVGPAAYSGGKNGVCSGAFEILHEVTNDGSPIDVGLHLTWQSVAGDPTISDIEWSVEEML